MKELEIHARDVEGAGKEILDLFLQNIDSRTIYFDGWSGFGTVAVLTSISQVIQSMEAPPPELRFGRTIYIDCSVWKSKRVMQRKIAEELKLDQKTKVMFDKQNEEDDFNGLAHGSRDVIRKVSAVIDRTLRESRFMMIFLNGSDDELVLSRFGIPEYQDCLIIWTFRRRFLTMHDYDDSKTKDKLRYTDLFMFGTYRYLELDSLRYRTLFRKEAATIFARYTHTQDVNLTVATECCLYGLFLHNVLNCTTRFGYAAQTPNLFICDGILQGGRAIEISNELHPHISFDCDASILENIYRKLLYENLETTSLVITKDSDVYEKRPYRWISMSLKNKEVQEDMATILARASSVFLAFEMISPPGLPIGLFKQCNKLSVLIISYCSFSFVSPPFLHCDTLRFLGLDQCTDNITIEGDSTAKWTCLHNLWVLDLRCTHWDEILSEEKIGLMANLWELNIEGVECWLYTGKLKEMLPYLQRLRIINPAHQAEGSVDINSSFVSKEKLEILDLSGNRDMKHLPTSLSKARRLQLLVLDGCDGLESVVLPKYSLRSFSFDGYGPASSRTSTIELPTKSSSSKPNNVDKKDVKISSISLEGCTQLENLFLCGLPNLVELDLSGCVLIKVLDLGTMIVDLPRLKRLFLLGCENLCAINWGLDIKSAEWKRIPNFPMELELLCIDTRPAARSQPRSSLPLALHASYRLQVHAVTADARLARSLWAPIHYYLQDNGNDVCFNINISSSAAIHGEVIQPEAATNKEMNHPCCHERQGHVVASTVLYGDVYAKVGDAQVLMPAFRQPPTEQFDHHVHIGDGGLNVESEMVVDFGHYNLSDLMMKHTQSLHVHDASTNTTTPIGSWSSLRWCRVERCRNLDTVFQKTGIDKNDCLENIWASDLLMARCIWEKGEMATFRSLRHLHLRSCPSLQYALPVCEGSMPSLETLRVMHCGNLRHIFVVSRYYLDSVLFLQLTNIHLHDLPALEQISEFKMITPYLQTIKIRGCWSLRRLPHIRNYSRPPAVEMEKDVWDALEWDGMAARHHPSLYQAPVHSRHYKKRMLKGTVLR